MVKILVTGSGEIINPTDLLSPCKVLGELLQQGKLWNIDYTQATEQESIAWGGADMMIRAVRAAIAGRSVSFMGTEYSFDDLQSLEDDITTSGYCVRLESDDANGVVIGIVQPQ